MTTPNNNNNGKPLSPQNKAYKPIDTLVRHWGNTTQSPGVEDKQKKICEESGLDSLLNLARMPHVKVQSLSISVINSLREKENGEIYVDSEEGFRPLVDLTKFAEEEVQREAVWSLAILASNSSCQARIEQEVGWHNFRKFAASSIPEIQAGTAILLGNLALEKTNQENLMAKGVPILMHMLQDTKDAKVRRAVVTSLSNVSIIEGFGAKDIWLNQGLELMMPFVEQSEDPQLQIGALNTIANVCNHDNAVELKRKVAELGGIGRLVPLLDSQEEMIVKLAAMTIANMASEEAHRKIMHELRIEEPLIRLLDSRDEEVQLGVTMAIHALADHGPTCNEFRNRQAADPLKELIHITKDRGIAKEAKGALAKIAPAELAALNLKRVSSFSSDTYTRTEDRSPRSASRSESRTASPSPSRSRSRTPRASGREDDSYTSEDDKSEDESVSKSASRSVNEDSEDEGKEKGRKKDKISMSASASESEHESDDDESKKEEGKKVDGEDSKNEGEKAQVAQDEVDKKRKEERQIKDEEEDERDDKSDDESESEEEDSKDNKDKDNLRASNYIGPDGADAPKSKEDKEKEIMEERVAEIRVSEEIAPEKQVASSSSAPPVPAKIDLKEKLSPLEEERQRKRQIEEEAFRQREIMAAQNKEIQEEDEEDIHADNGRDQGGVGSSSKAKESALKSDRDSIGKLMPPHPAKVLAQLLHKVYHQHKQGVSKQHLKEFDYFARRRERDQLTHGGEVIPILVYILIYYPDSDFPDIVVLALYILALLARHHIRNQVLIRRERGGDQMIRLLQSENEDVRRNASLALGAFCLNNSSLQNESARAIPILTRLLSSETNLSPTTKKTVAACLAAVADNNKTNQNLIMQVGGLRGISSMISDKTFMKSALHLVSAAVSQNSKVQNAIILDYPQIITDLLTILSSKEVSFTIQTYITNTLVELVKKNSRTQRLLYLNESVNKLVPLLADHEQQHPQTLINILYLLTILARSHKHARKVKADLVGKNNIAVYLRQLSSSRDNQLADLAINLTKILEGR